MPQNTFGDKSALVTHVCGVTWKLQEGVNQFKKQPFEEPFALDCFTVLLFHAATILGLPLEENISAFNVTLVIKLTPHEWMNPLWMRHKTSSMSYGIYLQSQIWCCCLHCRIAMLHYFNNLLSKGRVIFWCTIKSFLLIKCVFLFNRINPVFTWFSESTRNGFIVPKVFVGI